MAPLFHSLNEGQTFSRSISFSDGQDNGAAGWSYSIDYGDGSAPATGTTATPTITLPVGVSSWMSPPRSVLTSTICLSCRTLPRKP